MILSVNLGPWSFFLLVAAISSSGGRWRHARMHDGMSMPMDRPVDAATQAALQAWKRKRVQSPSGGFSSAARRAFDSGRRKHSTALGGCSPCVANLLSCFGHFPPYSQRHELLAFGSQSWYFGLTHHAEVLQHKVFAVLLAQSWFIELQRERGP